MNESCRTYEWVMSHTGMVHVTNWNVSRHTKNWVTWHIGRWPVTQMNKSSHFTRMHVLCHRYWRVMSNVVSLCVTTCVTMCYHWWPVTCRYHMGVDHLHMPAMSHVTHVNTSCHMSECVVSHIGMSHVIKTHHSCIRTNSCHWFHVTHRKVARHEQVISHVCTCCVTHMDETCQTWMMHWW